MGKERRNKSGRAPIGGSILERAGVANGGELSEPTDANRELASAAGSGGDTGGIDPASIPAGGSDAGGGGDTGGRKRRSDAGRSRGPRASKGENVIDLGSFGSILVSTHAMLATVTAVPELAIDGKEGDAMAKALANVMRHYDVPMVSAKTLDHIALLQCLATVYGTRIVAIRARKFAENAKRVRRTDEPPPAPPPAGSVEIPGFGPVPPPAQSAAPIINGGAHG